MPVSLQSYPPSPCQRSYCGPNWERRFPVTLPCLSLFASLGVPFPKNFLQICKKILCRLFRVFVHVYIHHFDRVIVMGAEAHVNTCYKHFYYFVTEMNLIDRKELEPLVSATCTESTEWCPEASPFVTVHCQAGGECPRIARGRLGRLQN